MSPLSPLADVSAETHRILHVDDEPDLAEMAATFLERENDRFEVVTATSATEGLNRLAETDFDCIISDYDMPGQNGIAFLETVRETRPDVPFILHTGKGSEEVASDAISAGVTDYLQKESGTSQYTVLANRVNNVIEQYYSQQAVKETQRKLSELAEKTDDILFMFDGDWDELLFINSAYEDIWGGSIADLEANQESFLDYIHPEDREKARESMAQLSSGEPDTIEYRVIDANDEQRWVRGDSKPVLDDDGTVLRIVGFVRDITEQKEREKELQQKERRYQAVFHDPNILAGLIDTDGTVLDINQTALEYIDASLDDVTDEPFWETPWFDHSETAQQAVREWIDRAASGEYVEFETDLVRPDGESYTVKGVFRPVTNDEGEVVSLLISDRDITEQKEHEQELETMNRRLEAILDNTTAPMFMKDNEGQYIFVNQGYRDLFGLEDADIVGRTDSDLHSPAVAEQVQENDQLVLDRGAPMETEECIVVDGTERVFLSTKVPIYDTGDRSDPERPVAVFGVASDITELTEQKQHLYETTSRLEVLFDKSPDMIDILDPEGILRDVNSRFCDELGYDEDEVLGRPIWEIDQLVDADDVNYLLSDFELDERRKLEGIYERRDGSTFPVEVHLLRLDIEGENRFLAISRDITERKETEQQLQEEQQFVQSIFDALPDPLYAFDTEGYPSRWNDRLEEVTGYTSDEIAEMHITEFVSEDKVERIATDFQTILEERTSVTVEAAVETKDGDHIPYELTGGPLENADGTLRGITGVGRNLTIRKEHEQRLKALNEVAHELMTAESRAEVVKRGVEAARDVLGLESSAIHLYEEGTGFVPVEQTATGYEHIGEPPTFTGGDSIAWRVYEQEESLALADVHDDPDIYNPETALQSELYLPFGEHGIMIAASDTAETFDQQDTVLGEILAGSIVGALNHVERMERIRAREQELTRQNDRLEEFASIVSHDLRNPLNVAGGRLELAQDECDSEHLDHVGRALDRMNVLIDDILALSREGEQVSELEPVDLENLTEACWQNVATAEATLRTNLERSIQADRSRLQQFLENLMRNAVEHGGKDVTVTIGALDDGFYVEDDGPGIPEDERDDVFETGYSTTEDGTGFGLNIVQQIADAHGWDIRVTNGSDGGVRFEITGIKLAE